MAKWRRAAEMTGGESGVVGAVRRFLSGNDRIPTMPTERSRDNPRGRQSATSRDETGMVAVVVAAVAAILVAEGSWDWWDLATGVFLITFLEAWRRNRGDLILWLAYVACGVVIVATGVTLL